MPQNGLRITIGAKLRWHLRGAVFRTIAGFCAGAIAVTALWGPASEAAQRIGQPTPAATVTVAGALVTLIECSEPVDQLTINVTTDGTDAAVTVNGNSTSVVTATQFVWVGNPDSRFVVAALGASGVSVESGGDCREVAQFNGPTPPQATPTPSSTRTTTQSTTRTEQRRVTVPFSTTRVKDTSLAAGKTKTLKEGRSGVRIDTFKVTYVDGREVSRVKVSSSWETKPVTKKVAYGPKPSTNSGPSDSGSKSASMSLQCSGAATVTATATGKGSVSVSISGPASGSNSGSGSATVRVRGLEAGVYRITGRAGSNVKLSYQWTGSC